MDDPMDENTRGMDRIGVEFPCWHKMLHLRHSQLTGGGHHRIEVPRGFAIDEIAFGIALPGMNDRDVRDDSAFHDISFAIKLADLLAFGNDGPNAGFGEKGRNASAACANPLRQGALRVEFEFEFPGKKLLRKKLILADIGRNHLLDLPSLKQNAETRAIDSRVIGDDGQVFRPKFVDRLDQFMWNAAETEAARHERHAVLEYVGKSRTSIRINLIHAHDPRVRALPVTRAANSGSWFLSRIFAFSEG